MTTDLFEGVADIGPPREAMAEGAVLLRGFAKPMESELIAALREITAASSEQSSGIGQVNTAVTQLDQMTQQNAALVEESAAAAESLKEQARKLSGVVSTFRLQAA